MERVIPRRWREVTKYCKALPRPYNVCVIAWNVGGKFVPPFAESLCKTKTSLGRSPVSSDVGGSSFVGLSVSENGSQSQKNKKIKNFRKIRLSRSVRPRGIEVYFFKSIPTPPVHIGTGRIDLPRTLRTFSRKTTSSKMKPSTNLQVGGDC